VVLSGSRSETTIRDRLAGVALADALELGLEDADFDAGALPPQAQSTNAAMTGGIHPRPGIGIFRTQFTKEAGRRLWSESQSAGTHRRPLRSAGRGSS